jgi:hypothetical protein
MPRHRKHKGGAADWSSWFAEKTSSLRSAVTGAPVPETPLIAEPVKEVTTMAQTAGRRIKKHVGVDPTSPKSARKLLKTAKGDRMLGRRRKTRKH